MHTLRPRSVMVGLVGLLVLAAWDSVQAQMQPASAELVRAVGRVDVMPKGQSTWSPASVGARLVEGDQIRALAASSADLTLPDGSTILVAENTRFAVTKLDYDAASRDRDASFHVVAGKVRAQVSTTAVQVIHARQSNFNISTPSGVAAVRGTIVVLAYNPSTQETLTYVFPSPGQAPSAARVTFVNKAGQAVTITGGSFVRQVGRNPPSPPQPIGNLPPAVQTALTTAQNTTTQGSTELVVISVSLPTSQETQNTVNAGTGGFGGGPVVPVSNPGPLPPPDWSGSGDPCASSNPPATCAAFTGKTCPSGTTGTPPNCVTATCPSGTTGTPPACVTAMCPSGQIGVPPNCRTCKSPPCEGG